MQFRVVLNELEGWFEEHGFPFAVIGGLALHAYGISRPTFDLDLITVGEAQDGAISFIEGLGYETLHRSRGFSNHHHADPERGRIDVVYVRGETARRLFQEAERRVLLEDIRVPIPRPEHLIALKLHAVQNEPGWTFQDLADIRLLMELPSVDEESVRQIFVERNQEGLYDRIQKQGQRPEPGG